MSDTRRLVIAGILIGVAIINLAILADVLGTVFFAITVASVLSPAVTWLENRGYRSWTASSIATSIAVIVLFSLVVPLLVVLYLRRDKLIDFVTAVPSEFVIEIREFSTVIDTSDIADMAIDYLTSVAISGAQAAPVIAAKLVVFVFVVFALLLHRKAFQETLLEAVPDSYHDVTISLKERVHSVLFALYVTQAATGFGTFLVALPIFWYFGYGTPIALAYTAGILQFLPVIGPSVIIFGLVLLELSRGAMVTGASILVVGLVFIGFLPDAVIRPRLARHTARLPASLYFVGFVGGVLSLGPIGIIAGPLAVALLVETISLLAEEIHPDRTFRG